MRKELFVGRAPELAQLQQLLDKKSASFVVIQGRRRIGKSSLVKKFAEPYRFISLIGHPPTKNTTAESEKALFAKQLATALDLPGLTAHDWSDLFAVLAKHTATGRVIILLDEISWMSTQDDTFLGKLKTAWDTAFKANPQLLLIVCGSVSIWIEDNILSHTGFMGRTSLNLTLKELPINECNQLLTAMGSKASAYEKFKMLAVTGGVPRYIEELQSKLSADDNIRRLCFTDSGILCREFGDIFHDLFTVKSEYYQKIVALLAEGSLDYESICKQLGVERSGFWLSYLTELVKAGLITRDYTWSPKTGLDSRLSRYRLSDNYLRFYLKHIAKNKSKIEKGLFASKALSSLPGWDSVMGLQFENLVLNNAPFIWQQLNLTANDIVTHGAYFQNTTKLHPGCQIDYLIKTRHNTLFACEVKFSRAPIGLEILDAMQPKISALKLPKNYACWPVLIHVNGVSAPLLESDYFSRVIDFTKLL